MSGAGPRLEVLDRFLKADGRDGGAVLVFECAPEAVCLAARGAGRIYVVDRRAHRLRAAREALTDAGREEAALFFHGGLAEFRRDLQTIPMAVVLGGEGGALEWGEAAELGSLVNPGTPLLALPAAGEAVARVLVEGGWFAESLPQGSGDALWFQATALCEGLGAELDDEAFREVKQRLDRRYFLLDELSRGGYTPAARETRPAREAVLARLRKRRHGWPYARGAAARRPDTLPGRRPWPRISIVTPSFHQGAYIEETILSVLNQGYPNAEHIIVDGGSEDDTAAVLEKHRGRLAHVISEPDRGQAHAINKGMALATGDILTWLNSDDLLAPGALHAVALAFLTSGADLVAGMCGTYEDGRITGYHLASAGDGPLDLTDLLDLDRGWNAGRFFYQPEVMFTRELWERAGGHVREDLAYSMDYELWLRFAQAGARLHVIGRPVAWFRIHRKQKTADPGVFQPELREVQRRFATRTGTVPPSRERNTAEARRRLRIVLLNDRGYAYGAGLAHQRLAQALAAAGHDVQALSLRDKAELMQGALRRPGRVVERVAELEPDLILVGNLHGSAATPLLYHQLGRIAPVHVVLHDFWPITGRCAYPMECTKYLTGCDASCPTAGEYPSLPPDQIAGAWQEKRRVMTAETRPCLLAASSWAESVAVEALRAFGQSGGETGVGRIRLGVPVETFRRLDKAAARVALGLPEEKFIVMASGDRLEDQRKGLRDVIESVHILDLPDLLLVLAGPRDLPPGSDPGRIMTLGYLEDPSRLAMAYAAADLFVSASRAETFGQVFLEAAACGTPVIGYGSSGVAEAVCPGVTGSLLAEPGPEALAAEILGYYQDPERCRAIGAWGRIWVENEYSLHRCYLSFARLWRRLGLAERWNLWPKIDFRPGIPPPPALLSLYSGGPEGVETHDLGEPEGPFPELGLGRFRWAYGPATRVRWRAAHAGSFLLLLSYRNPHRGQRLRVRVNGTTCCEKKLACTGYEKGRLLVADLPLEEGVNEIRLEFSRWSRGGKDPRPLAVIVEEFDIIPAAPARGA